MAAQSNADDDTEFMGEWPLSTEQRKHIMKIKTLYGSKNVTAYPKDQASPFQTPLEYTGRMTIRSYFAARRPLRDADVEMLHAGPFGFLCKEVHVMATLLRNYKLKEIKTPLDRHSGASLIIHEFHLFVRDLASIQEPSPECHEQIAQRIDLIEILVQDRPIDPDKYQSFLAPMLQIARQLRRISKLWPVFSAQMHISVQLELAKTKIDIALLQLLAYCFYCIKSESDDFSFDTRSWKPSQQEMNLHDEVFCWLMKQEHVNAFCESSCSSLAAAPSRLFDILGRSWLNPAEATGLIVASIEADPASGLISKELMQETDMNSQEYASVIMLWLTLIREAEGLARGRQMLQYAQTLSCLGGELFLARQTSKDLMLSALAFIQNRLKVINDSMQQQQDLLLNASTKGIVKNQQNYVLDNPAFASWSQNFTYAKKDCSTVVQNQTQSACEILRKLQNDTHSLDAEVVDKTIGRAGQHLISLCKESFDLYGQALPQCLTENTSQPQLSPQLTHLAGQCTTEAGLISTGKSLTTSGYWTTSRAATILPAAIMANAVSTYVSSLEAVQYTVEVRLKRQHGDDAELRTIKFGKSIGYEDMADLLALRTEQPVFSVGLSGIGAMCGVDGLSDIISTFAASHPKGQKVKRSDKTFFERGKYSNALNSTLLMIEEQLGTCIPPGHAPILVRELALSSDLSLQQQNIRVSSMALPTNGSLVTVVVLTVDLERRGYCCFMSEMEWSAELSVLTLGSFTELVRHITKVVKERRPAAAAGEDTQADEFQQSLSEELHGWIVEGTKIMESRFSLSNYPQVQEMLDRGYEIQDYSIETLSQTQCTIS
eukprot:TRINITY_DN37140_c0_g1_i1.p1 TRINITY_DN37140_c0_g1~~TRINITY_DN37140_c0_g1_i1.p1  ORF type:complete len:841 (+),score=107.85 TRINITY_DN37140_c0_g1_i1:35-2524(+)